MDKDIAGNILDKIEGKAGLLGGAFGFINCPMANAGGINSAMLEVMMTRISHWHPPNPFKILEMEMALPAEFPIMDYAMGTIASWILQQAGPIIDSRLGQLGRVAKKTLISALIANIVSGFLWLAPFNPTGAAGMGTSPVAGWGTSPRGGMYGTPTNSPQWSGAPGGPGTPHTTGADGFRSQLKWERVAYT